MAVQALFRQRLRWAEGLVRRDLRETLPLLARRGLRPGQRFDILGYFSQSLAPFAAIGLLLADGPGRRGRLASLVGGYAVGAGALAYDALRWSVGPGGLPPATLQRIGRAAAVVAWSALWLVVLPVAQVRVVIGRGPLRFHKTVHGGGYELPPDVLSGGPDLPPRSSWHQVGAQGAGDHCP
jgi:hypothetical protein